MEEFVQKKVKQPDLLGALDAFLNNIRDEITNLPVTATERIKKFFVFKYNLRYGNYVETLK